MSDDEKKNLPDVIRPDSVIVDPGVSDDFNYARDTIRDTVEIAKSALGDMAILAHQAQHPKVYESLSKMVAVTLAGAETLLSVRQRKKSLEPKSQDSSEGPKKIVNNQLFVGSTSELAKFLKSQRDGEDEDST